MREIKFRGRRLDTGEWAYGSLVLYRNATPDIYDKETSQYFAVDIETIGQYIGLKDKNGAEMYEGDIVAIEDPDQDVFSGVVVFIAAEFLIRVNPGTVPHYPNIRYIPIFPGRGRVVGNTYENTELLKDTK